MKCKICLLMLFVFVFFSCNLKQTTPEKNNANFENKSEKPERYNLTLIAAGDNLFHETIIRTHRQNEKYDFSPIYSEIKSIVEKADLAFINQETVMAGEAFGYSGYPLFNTPQSLAGTLSDTGFNIINIANNHTMDMGRAGVYATLDLFDNMENITVIGARKTGQNANAQAGSLITMNNITLGFLSYTYGLNGHALPAGEPNLVSLINRTRMAQEIGALRPLCDFLVVSMHWGEEYLLIEPGQDQTALARFLSEQNVDLVIGHHPHVLQRVERLPRPDGKETLCFYSLGNFVSHQRGKERLLGGIMAVTFTKEETITQPPRFFISNSGLIPIICHFDQNFLNTKIYPLHAYTEELLERHHQRIRDDKMDMESFNLILMKLRTKLISHTMFLTDSW